MFVVLPSGAVTVTVILFVPTCRLLYAPLTEYFAPCACTFAYTCTDVTLFGTVALYVVVLDLNPVKSFGVIPKFDSFALFDAVVVEVLPLLLLVLPLFPEFPLLKLTVFALKFTFPPLWVESGFCGVIVTVVPLPSSCYIYSS